MKKRGFLNSSVIGLGFGNSHAKIIKKNLNSKLDYICDKKIKFKDLAKKLKCKFTNDSSIAISNKSTKLITIASFDNYHFSQIKRCIKMKKHIFVEKPFCQNFKQYKFIKNLISKSNLYFSTNLVLRNHPKFKKIKELVNKKKLGKIYHIEGDYNYGRLYKLLYGWRGKIPFYSVTQGGGIHIIDLMIWILNSTPKDVFAIGNKISTNKSNFKHLDNVTGLINFKNGVTGKVTSNFGSVMPHDHQMRIFGTKGSLNLSHDKITFFSSRKPKKKNLSIKFNKDKNYKQKILDSFINSIVLKKKFRLILKKDIFASMSTCLAIDKSLKTKKKEIVKI